MRCAVYVVLGVCVLACDAGAPPLQPPGEPDGDVPALSDRDRDGVCDETERVLGSDLDRLDTDNDGLPDLIEAALSFDPVDGEDPNQARLATLSGSVGATLDYPVRATSQGTGNALQGAFMALSSIYSEAETAQDFYVTALAVSAEPPDHVRSIEGSEARFIQVEGETRLSFNLNFAYPHAAPMGCSRAYPFRFVVNSDDGKRLATELRVLLVTAEGAGPKDASAYCIPDDCL